MAEDNEGLPTPSVAGSSDSSGGGKLVPLLTVINLLVTFGILGMLGFSFMNEKSKQSIGDMSAGHHAATEASDDGHGGGAEGAPAGEQDAKLSGVEFGKIIELEEFTINLSTLGSVNPRFVRVNISIEIPEGDAEVEVQKKMPQIRNTIIDLFNSKRPNDLTTSDGRDYLKEEIKKAINAFMVTGKLKGVFFTNFAISS